MAQVYALKYLAKAAVSAPRDIVNSYVARHRPIHPTVLIFHCTFVCDARCDPLPGSEKRISQAIAARMMTSRAATRP